ncbi:peptidase U32 family protein [Anaeromyxobacter diazotrophicus]|uniref:peptidase U32 family protein n=1 Tax=Anaeromyxobacter diazotrophicus TaxID=2590199 RepID=UPI0015926350|nr:U32 family peptidase [Anaeromyxobacter diazotrophicus]
MSRSSTAEGPRRPELLAPAGGLEAGLAALQYGADAVYLGLKRFSARADAQNFTLDELDRFLGHARALTPVRRAFVAVNTLVLDRELPGLVDTLGDLADLGADALIVQDLGVARLARRHFPQLELHASTQLAAHSRAGVETLRDLGFARVTLARELTLEELRDCAAVPGVEVEAFLHGALCYAYSGLCLFSSHVLGRSGNRGSCAYPCRDRWEVTSLDGPPLPERLRSGFAFSMKDLALPDHVGALRDAGVACLKIEGRKKGPTYVAAAVDYYRRLLDGTLPAAERPEREADLKATFARPWTTLYLDSHREKDVADRDLVGHRGAPLGQVEAVVRSGAGAAIRFRTARALARHDGLQVEVPGLDRPFGFGVSSLRLVTRGAAADVFEAPAGALVEVPLPDDYPTVPRGAPVSCSSSQAVKLRYQLERPKLAQRARRPMSVAAEVSETGLRLEASAEAAPGHAVRAEVTVAGALEAARDPAGMAASARAAFEKLGDTRFRLAGLDWRNPAGRFVPVSRLNEARRALAEALDAAVTAHARGQVEAARAAEAALTPGAAAPGDAPRFTVKVDRLEALDAFEPEDFEGADDVVVDLGLLPLRGLVERLSALTARAGPERLRLGLPLIVRGWEERALRARVEALRAAGYRRWELTGPASWAHLGLAPGDAGGLDLSSDWSLYAVNRAAARQLRDLGVGRITLSTEDVRENLAALLAELGPAASVVVYEDSPLFISESCPYANLAGGCPGPASCTFERMELTSSHGGKALVVNERCRAFTLNDAPYNLSPRLAALREAGARSFRVHFVHRPYAPERARELWRALRRGQVVRPGHLGNFDREAW